MSDDDPGCVSACDGAGGSPVCVGVGNVLVFDNAVGTVVGDSLGGAPGCACDGIGCGSVSVAGKGCCDAAATSTGGVEEYPSKVLMLMSRNLYSSCPWKHLSLQ